MAAPIFFTRVARSMASRSKSIASSALDHSPPSISSPPTRRLVASSASRLASAALGVFVETEKPLHSAIASSRLRSNIAFHSTCWSWLSQV
ncbi:hypothetical protein Droror1_Dr00016660 [Drosera rotundifolia]